MQKSSVSKISYGLVSAAIITIFSSSSAQAVNSTWAPTPGTADWATGANWVSGTAAGATTGLTNGDTATFLTNTNGNGTTTPLVIDANRNIKSLTFGTGAILPASFTIGTTGGNSLLLTSGGAISFIGSAAGTNVTVAVNAPLVLEPATSTTAGAYSFSNAHSTASNKLVIGGAVSGGTTTSNVVLTLTGANGGANEVSGIISDGGATGGLAIAKTSSGLWILSGSNTYTGGTTLTSGTLSISSAANLGGATSALTIGGGVLQITGTNLASTSALGRTINFSPGVNVTIDSGTNTFTLDSALNATSGVTKVGTGTMIINQATNYSGTTTISAGTLRLSSANNSAGATNVANGTLQLNNASNGGLASGTLTLGSAAVQSLLANQAISNNVLLNGTITFSGTNSMILNGAVTNNTAIRTISNTLGSTAALTFAGNLYLSDSSSVGKQITFAGIGTNIFSGTIANFNGGAGTGGTLFLNGTGTTIISGTSNTYSGGTIIAAGSGPGASVVVTTVGNVGGAGSSLGTGGVLTIGSGVNNGKLVYAGTGEDTDRVVNLGGSGTGVTGAAIIDQSGSGLLKFTSNFTSAAGAKTLTLQGSTAGTGEIAGTIVDNSGTTATSVTKLGTGTWTLSGANTYSGTTSISAGTLVVTSTNGLGTSTLAAAVTLSNGTLSLLNNGAGNNGTIVYGPGSGYNVTGPNNTNGTINVGNNTANTGNTIQLGSLALANTGLTLTNSNGYNLSFAGNTTMTGSRSIINNMTNGTATLGTFTSLDAGARTVTFSGTSTSAVTSVGSISQNGANALNVSQTSVGTLVLTGNNTYTGTTGVTAGTLLVNGTHTGGSAYSIGATGALGGTGSISATSLTSVAGSKLTAGDNGIGNLTLSLSGGMNISASSTGVGNYLFDLGSGNVSDRITLTLGTLNFGNLSFDDFTFTGGQGSQTYILFDASSAITFSGTGVLTGTVNGIGATLSYDSTNFNIILTTAAIPEPQTWAMFVLGGFGILIFVRRARGVQSR